MNHECKPQPLPGGWYDDTQITFKHPKYGKVVRSSSTNKWHAWIGTACISTKETWPEAIKELIDYYNKHTSEIDL